MAHFSGLLIALLLLGSALGAVEAGTPPQAAISAVLLVASPAAGTVAGLEDRLSARVVLVTAGNGPEEDAIISLRPGPDFLGRTPPTGLVAASLLPPSGDDPAWTLLAAIAKAEPGSSTAALPDEAGFRTRLRDLLLGAETFAASSPLPAPDRSDSEPVASSAPASTTALPQAPVRSVPAAPTALARVVRRRGDRVLTELVEGRARPGPAVLGLEPRASAVTIEANDGRFLLLSGVPAELPEILLLRQAPSP